MQYSESVFCGICGKRLAWVIRGGQLNLGLWCDTCVHEREADVEAEQQEQAEAFFDELEERGT